jgi:carbon monoxide dehydrogenase subunit G
MEWTGARYADAPTVSSSTWIAAEPARVWNVITDVSVMPALSEELQSIEWLDGATAPAVGARFVGFNKHPSLGEWSTESQISEMRADKAFAWTVGDPTDPSATWRFDLAPEGDGTRLEYCAQLGPGRSGLSYAIDSMPEKEQKIVFVRLREFENGIIATLAGIKNLVEGDPA